MTLELGFGLEFEGNKYQSKFLTIICQVNIYVWIIETNEVIKYLRVLYSKVCIKSY